MGMLNLGLGGGGGGAGTVNHFDRRPISVQTAPIDYWVSISVTEKLRLVL